MEPNEVIYQSSTTNLPPSIQLMESSRKAFNLPDLQLPSYEEIGKMVDNVFIRQDNGGLTPRKPTFEEQLDEDVRKIGSTPDWLNPIAAYSKTESEGFNNPSLPYDPTVDMNELYAKYDPVTWGDSFEKAWDTAANNMWSGTQNIWQGLKEGITEGRPSALWDNKYSKELAEMTLNLEKMKPMRFSEEEADSTSAWLKQVFPSLGYVASSVVEMAAQHAAFTVAGAAIGAATGAGIGAIPGAIVGNIAALAKDAQTLATTVTNIHRASRAVSALSTANKIKKGGQLLGYGLLSANGEAALNSQLASHRALEEQKANYYKQTGQYLSGAELTEAEEAAFKTGSTTFALNLPLIAAGNLFQFGNLVRGKYAPQITEKLAFTVDKAGKAVMRPWSPYTKVFGGYLKEAGSEGLEEISQGIIEDSAVNYYTSRADNRKNFLDEFANAAWNRATTAEGRSDFLAGALIGGISNVGTLGGFQTVKNNTKDFVTKYNSSTGEYFNNLADAININEGLKNALKVGDGETAKALFQKSLISMVNGHAKMGSTQAFSETLDAMSDMDNADFREHFNISIDKDQQDTLMAEITKEYKVAAKQRQIVDSAFQVNPFEAESWFQRQINKRKDSFQLGDNKVAAQQVWDVFKDTLTDNLVRYGTVGEERSRLEQEGQDLSPDFVTFSGANPASVVETQKQLLRDRVAAKLPGYEKEADLLTRLEAATPEEQYAILLNQADKAAPGLRDVVLRHNRQLQLEQILFDKVNNLNTQAGQRKEIKKILDWQRYYEKKVAEQDGIVPETTVPEVTPEVVETETVTPEAITPEVVEGVTPTEVITPVVTPSVVPPIAPDPLTSVEAQEDINVTEILDEDVFIPDNIDSISEEELDNFYGEGKGEDYTPPTPRTVVEETPRSKKVIEDIIDPELPSDIQINEAAFVEAVEELQPGEEIIPEDSGVTIKRGGKKVSKITKEGSDGSQDSQEKGKVKIENEEGESFIVNNDALSLTQNTEITSSNDPIADIVTREGLNVEKSELLRFLNDRGYIEIEC